MASEIGPVDYLDFGPAPLQLTERKRTRTTRRTIDTAAKIDRSGPALTEKTTAVPRNCKTGLQSQLLKENELELKKLRSEIATAQKVEVELRSEIDDRVYIATEPLKAEKAKLQAAFERSPPRPHRRNRLRFLDARLSPRRAIPRCVSVLPQHTSGAGDTLLLRNRADDDGQFRSIREPGAALRLRQLGARAPGPPTVAVGLNYQSTKLWLPATKTVHPKSSSRKVSAASNELAAGCANALA